MIILFFFIFFYLMIILFFQINDLVHHNKGKLQMTIVNCNKESSKLLEYIKIMFNIKVSFNFFKKKNDVFLHSLLF